ncbi:hypothetical protein O181_058752 [Austropuccinia psidii MF-1]|uniref:Uncharacterized protein n=1 Tax=Austropuccinia psidii MF-1 TaxID=1389203 RepID=A0A9Q3EFB8_9BASI|nr:hypothetical protein [Austropuccinia psidii MF-1]
MANQQNINPLLFGCHPLVIPTRNWPQVILEVIVESDKQSSEEYKGEDDEYFIADNIGLGVDDNTPPKRRRIQSNIYDYFEKLNPSGEWVEAKGNFRFIVKLAIIGHNTSNLNKHRGHFCGRFNAWESKAPGSVDPNMGTKIAAKEQDSILKQLVEALVAIPVSF